MALKVISGMVVAAARGPKHPQPHPESKWFRQIESSLVQRAVLLMEQQPLGRPLVLHEVATRLGVGLRTLVRGFQRAFRLSPSTFFRALRMSHGRWELLNTDKSIGRIALDHGFSDASHFTRLFRQYYGLTPARAREKASQTSSKARRTGLSGQRTRRTALQEILPGETLSFAAIDWPSEAADNRREIAGHSSFKRQAVAYWAH
jgi:transcriptional regulator GlxA family with amidase domain